MAAYPSLPIVYGSSEKSDDGSESGRTSNGSLFSFTYYSGDKKTFVVKHEYLTNSEKGQLDSHRAADKFNSFSFVWPADGVSYTVRYVKAPERIPARGMLWHVTNELMEV